VTSTLSFEGNGQIDEYVGGYDDWLRQRTKAKTKSRPVEKVITSKVSQKKQTKLSYKLQKELDELPKRIEDLEQAQQALHDSMAEADYFKRDKDEIASDQLKLAEIDSNLEAAYGRWEELDA
jgi:ATP-binding cassette subfamily F protein uup